MYPSFPNIAAAYQHDTWYLAPASDYFRQYDDSDHSLISHDSNYSSFHLVLPSISHNHSSTAVDGGSMMMPE